MTAILRELRTLEERLARKDITDAQYRAQRLEILESVDVVEPNFVETTAEPTPMIVRPPGSMSWTLGIIICLGVVGICLCLAMLTFADFNLALTLGVTLLAALSVALLRGLEE